MRLKDFYLLKLRSNSTRLIAENRTGKNVEYWVQESGRKWERHFLANYTQYHGPRPRGHEYHSNTRLGIMTHQTRNIGDILATVMQTAANFVQEMEL